MDRGYAFVTGVFAVWRITYAITMEDGPARLLVRFRQAARRWGPGLDCFYCASVWFALPLAIAIGTTTFERALLWPALSGGACLLHRFTDRGQSAAVYWEEPEEHDVLRKRADESRPAAHTPHTH
jgi:hypothetical protein